MASTIRTCNHQPLQRRNQVVAESVIETVSGQRGEEPDATSARDSGAFHKSK